MITVREFTTQERVDFNERKLEEFLHEYYTTNLTVNKILEKIGLSINNKTSQYIRRELRAMGINTHVRGCLRCNNGM